MARVVSSTVSSNPAHNRNTANRNDQISRTGETVSG